MLLRRDIAVFTFISSLSRFLIYLSLLCSLFENEMKFYEQNRTLLHREPAGKDRRLGHLSARRMDSARVYVLPRRSHQAHTLHPCGIHGSLLLGIGANAYFRRIPIHIKSKKDRLLSSRSFSLISLRTLYSKNEMSTPAATAEPMTPEMLDAIQ